MLRARSIDRIYVGEIAPTRTTAEWEALPPRLDLPHTASPKVSPPGSPAGPLQRPPRRHPPPPHIVRRAHARVLCGEGEIERKAVAAAQGGGTEHRVHPVEDVDRDEAASQL